MANIESAIKEQRKTKKRTVANKKVKSNVKELIKNSRKEIAASASSADAKGKAADLVRQACKALDKAGRKGVIKKNAAARKKSRLMKMLNKNR